MKYFFSIYTRYLSIAGVCWASTESFGRFFLVPTKTQLSSSSAILQLQQNHLSATENVSSYHIIFKFDEPTSWSARRCPWNLKKTILTKENLEFFLAHVITHPRGTSWKNVGPIGLAVWPAIKKISFKLKHFNSLYMYVYIY